jgi:hypothetical protein
MLQVSILKKGDRVINVWSDENGLRVAVERKGDVHVLTVDQEPGGGFPKLNQSKTLVIGTGESTVSLSVPLNPSGGKRRTKDDTITVTSF